MFFMTQRKKIILKTTHAPYRSPFGVMYIMGAFFYLLIGLIEDKYKKMR